MGSCRHCMFTNFRSFRAPGVCWPRHVSGHRLGDNAAQRKDNLDALLPRPGMIARVTHYAGVPVRDPSHFFARIGQLHEADKAGRQRASERVSQCGDLAGERIW